jgi:prevent-host-death family protein
MNEYSVARAKAKFSEMLAKVRAGREVVITRRGAPIARISSVVRTRKPLDLAAVDAFRASLPVQAERSAGLVRRMRDDQY